MYAKDPLAVKNYAIDWSERYPADTIASFVLTTTGGVVVDDSMSAGLQVQYTLSGGVVDTMAEVQCVTTFGSGQVDVWTDTFNIIDQ